MADNEKGGDNTSVRGIDWEVVSLTASAYAAAPGPNPFETSTESKKEMDKDENAASAALFMSGHFTFPPSEYKNILMEPNCNEIQKELESENEEHNVDIKSDIDDLKMKSDFFDDEKAWEEEIIYENPSFSALSAKTNISQSDLFEESTDDAEVKENLSEEKQVDDRDIPSEAWWKSRALSLYNYCKESNKFWSVFVAAAVMGFAILGHKWQREKLQLQQLKWYSFSDESLRRMLGPVNRFKNILVGGNQQSYMLRGGAASSHMSI